MSHILVTRPSEDAGRLIRHLTENGHQVTHAPLMTIAPLATDIRDLDGCQAILFTSANGLRAFARLSPRRDLAVYAVGPATAQAAREAGFTRIAAAGGDVQSLAALVARRLTPADGPLYHAAGKIIAGDLGVLLAPHGFAVRREVLYSAEAVDRLPEPARRALEAGQLDLALFYSPRTARIFMSLVSTAGLLDRLAGITAGALSPAVAKALESGSWPLQSSVWQRIVTAAEPAERALLDALGL